MICFTFIVIINGVVVGGSGGVLLPWYNVICVVVSDFSFLTVNSNITNGRLLVHFCSVLLLVGQVILHTNQDWTFHVIRLNPNNHDAISSD